MNSDEIKKQFMQIFVAVNNFNLDSYSDNDIDAIKPFLERFNNIYTNHANELEEVLFREGCDSSSFVHQVWEIEDIVKNVETRRAYQ